MPGEGIGIGLVGGLFLMVLGVDYAILWGAMAFVLSYIPYVGLFTAMVPPTILALAEHGIGMAILVAASPLVILAVTTTDFMHLTAAYQQMLAIEKR